jgi:hypothetical protein
VDTTRLPSPPVSPWRAVDGQVIEWTAVAQPTLRP